MSVDGQSVADSLEELQSALYARSRSEVEARVLEVGNYDEFKAVMASGRGFVLAPWDGQAATEARVKEETGATTRVMHPEKPQSDVKCLFSGDRAEFYAYFATSY
jgi:prolyl-tRNA synthetase